MSIIAKYKYDGSVYADLIPEFNTEFTSDLYTVTDEVDGEVTTRTIESDSLPTLMRFGSTVTSGAGDYTKQYSLLEILELNTSNITDMSLMFFPCLQLTTICNLDTSKVTNTYAMFSGCSKLTELDVSGFNTSNVTNMQNMFRGCSSLTSLDLSGFNTSNATNMSGMFYNCSSLTSLDVSNFNTSKVTNITNMFYNTSLLTDIGMIYCDQSTINKVASLLPTDIHRTIWVESDDILQYNQYDHIAYKTQKVQDTVHLNSPLLKGDTIEVIDGKTYHVHKYEKAVLDGSENWLDFGYTDDTIVSFKYAIDNTTGIPIYRYIISDRFKTLVSHETVFENWSEGIALHGWTYGNVICINKSKLSTQDINGFKQWLSENPVTVIYELATPYYELISEEPLELTLLDATDNTINNNSILPSNMTIANKELSTIAIKPLTTYTLAFDKSIKDSAVTIDICGGEQVTTVGNMVQLTTPSELGSCIRFISSDGCIVSNVRLIEGGLVEEAMPEESFEGLQSSFDDGYIIRENLVEFTPTIINNAQNYFLNKLEIGKVYTIIVSKEKGKALTIGFTDINNYTWTSDAINLTHFNKNIVVLTAKEGSSHLRCYTGTTDTTIDNLVVLEGNHTHLSEAELMRYIEKGTSHYEEEDYNHVGKYKVEYKVTGKNKLNTKDFHCKANSNCSYDANTGTFTHNGTGYGDVQIYAYLHKKTYIVNVQTGTRSRFSIMKGRQTQYVDSAMVYGQTIQDYIPFVIDEEGWYTFHMALSRTDNVIWTFSNIQIEEGTTPTEYEPYKEYTKTFYLNSPLLEGDTIEDVNGVATHVKRYGKTVLDGSGDEGWRVQGEYFISSDACLPHTNTTNIDMINTIAPNVEYTILDNGGYGTNLSYGFRLNLQNMNVRNNTVEELKSWLQTNPIIVVSKLKNPIYEPISDESILCDSYANGHLDFDTNIPINKTKFLPYIEELNYLYPTSIYTIQFKASKNSTINLYLGGADLNNISIIEGINTFQITTPDTLLDNILQISSKNALEISNVSVVQTTQDFGYFKGLQSTFESNLNEDNTYNVRITSYNSPIKFGKGGSL